MENLEDVLEELEKFEKSGCSNITEVLDDYLHSVAKTGDTVFSWLKIRQLIRYKLTMVMNDFYENYGGEEVVEPSVNSRFNFRINRDKILQHFDTFSGAPFTIQRLCEIITDPQKHYKRTDKFLRGLEKNVLVVSCIEPGRSRGKSHTEQQQMNLVNGLQEGFSFHSSDNDSVVSPRFLKSNLSLSPHADSGSYEDVEMSNIAEDHDRRLSANGFLDVQVSPSFNEDEPTTPPAKKLRNDCSDSSSSDSSTEERLESSSDSSSDSDQIIDSIPSVSNPSSVSDSSSNTRTLFNENISREACLVNDSFDVGSGSYGSQTAQLDTSEAESTVEQKGGSQDEVAVHIFTQDQVGTSDEAYELLPESEISSDNAPSPDLCERVGEDDFVGSSDAFTHVADQSVAMTRHVNEMSSGSPDSVEESNQEIEKQQNDYRDISSEAIALTLEGDTDKEAELHDMLHSPVADSTSSQTNGQRFASGPSPTGTLAQAGAATEENSVSLEPGSASECPQSDSFDATSQSSQDLVLSDDEAFEYGRVPIPRPETVNNGHPNSTPNHEYPGKGGGCSTAPSSSLVVSQSTSVE